MNEIMEPDVAVPASAGAGRVDTQQAIELRRREIAEAMVRREREQKEAEQRAVVAYRYD